MSSRQAARRRSNKTQPECMDYDDQQLEILTSRAVLKKGPGHNTYLLTTNRDATLPLSPGRDLRRRRNHLSPYADPGNPPHLLKSLRLTSHPERITAGPPK